ncbi:MAG: hypothetical protein RL385_418 [Pseudomonadota bacterium]|jgi:hypothetical protein
MNLNGSAHQLETAEDQSAHRLSCHGLSRRLGGDHGGSFAARTLTAELHDARPEPRGQYEQYARSSRQKFLC